MKKNLMKTLRAVLVVNLTLSLFMFFGIESLLDRTEPRVGMAIGIMAWFVASGIATKAVINSVEELEDKEKK